MRRLVAALAILAAVASPAAAADRFGAAIGPVPLVVEDWGAPAFTIDNRGSVPIHVELTLDGDGYALAATSADLAAAGVVTFPLSRVGNGSATVKATVTNAEPGMDHQVLVLQGTVRHWNTVEQLAHDLAPYWWVLIVIGAILILTIRVRPWEFRIRRRDRKYVER